MLSGDKKREEGSYERKGGISGQNNFALIKISSVEVLFLLFIWMERAKYGGFSISDLRNLGVKKIQILKMPTLEASDGQPDEKHCMRNSYRIHNP